MHNMVVQIYESEELTTGEAGMQSILNKCANETFTDATGNYLCDSLQLI